MMNDKMNIQCFRQSSARMLLLSIIIFFSQCQKNFEYQPSPSRPNGKLSVDIVTFLRSRNDFTLLSQAIDKTGLAVTLSGPGPITLFAPDDLAFKAYLGTKKLDDIPVNTLENILLYHAVNQNLLSQNLTLFRENYESLLPGKKLEVFRNNSFVVTVNGNQVFTSNIEPTNGVIHVIAKVLIP